MALKTATRTVKTKAAYRCEWREVVALNFKVDPRVLQPHLPAGARILQFNDHVLLTLMAKNVREVQPYGRSLTLFRSIDEIDFRTYISMPVDGEMRRGHLKLRNLISHKMAGRVFKLLTGQTQELISSQRSTSGFEEARRDALPTANYQWTNADQKNQFLVKARNAALSLIHI